MKANLSRFLFIVAATVVSVLVSSEPSKAVTYSYLSPLTNVSVFCSPQPVPCGGSASWLKIQIFDDLPLGASGSFSVGALMSSDIGAFLGGPVGSGFGLATGGSVTLNYGSVVDWNFAAAYASSNFDVSFSSTPTEDQSGLSFSQIFNDELCNCNGFVGVSASGGPGIWTPDFTPLPATLPLFASGLAGLGLLDWRRKRKALELG